MFDIVERVAAHRALPALAAGLAVMLTSSAVSVGFVLDDVLLSRGQSLARPWDGAPRTLGDSLFEMFAWVRKDPQATQKLIADGVFPWWTFAQMRLAFWRPLAALTHWIDFSIWPNNPIPMHVQNLLWLAFLVGIAAAAYRRLPGPSWATGLATIAYATSPHFGEAVGWISARNSLVCAFFGISALVAHSQSHNRPVVIVVAPACFLLSLLGGEAGLSAAGYLLAYFLFVGSGERRLHLVSLLLCGGVGLIWMAIYTALGFGATGVTSYFDPIREPRWFLSQLPAEFATRIAALILPIEPRTLAGATLLAVLGVGLLRALRADAWTRFWVVGTALALLPTCTTVRPESRTLILSAFGASGLVARLAYLGFKGAPRGGDGLPSFLTGALAVILLFVQVMSGMWLLPTRAGRFTDVQAQLERWLPNSASAEAGIGGRDLLLVNAPDPLAFVYLPAIRRLRGEPQPRHLLILTTRASGFLLERLDDHLLRIQHEQGLFSPDVFYKTFRSPRHPMTRGERIDLGWVTIDVEDTTREGIPSSARFRFQTPLDDPSLVVLERRDGTYLRLDSR